MITYNSKICIGWWVTITYVVQKRMAANEFDMFALPAYERKLLIYIEMQRNVENSNEKKFKNRIFNVSKHELAYYKK